MKKLLARAKLEAEKEKAKGKDDGGQRMDDARQEASEPSSVPLPLPPPVTSKALSLEVLHLLDLPFVSAARRPQEIISSGHQNPWRTTKGRRRGECWKKRRRKSQRSTFHQVFHLQRT
jgi:hypothetical protein